MSLVHHIAMGSPDPQRLAKFYVDVLGLERIYSRPTAGEPEAATESVWLSLGPQTVLMIERATAKPAAAVESSTAAAASDSNSEDSLAAFRSIAPGYHLIALRIRKDERETYEERLTAAGVAIVHRSAYTLYFRDPEGNRLGLSWLDFGEFLERIDASV